MFELENRIASYMSAYRYEHTLSVVSECIELAKLFNIDNKNLAVSAYLHDISKELDLQEQLKICREMDIEVDSDCILSPKTLHAFTAPAVIKRDFPEFYKEEIVNTVSYHTTGRENMSLNEKLLFLADYIEPKRQFDDCKELRKYFYNNKSKDLYKTLDETIFLALKYTISDLLDKKAFIHPKTFNAYNYMQKELGR